MATGESMGIRKVYRNKGLQFVDMDLGGREISQTYKSPTSRQKVKAQLGLPL